MSDHHKSQLSAPFPPLTSSNFGLVALTAVVVVVVVLVVVVF